MMSVLKDKSLSAEEFWNMPLSTLLEFTGMLVAPEKKPMSRKRLLAQERKYAKRRQVH